MREWFFQVLEASLYGSVVILAVMALRLVLKKAPRSLFCLLWLLAGLRLMLPMEIESGLSLQPRLAPAEQSQTVTLPVPTPETVPVPAAPPEPMDEEAIQDTYDVIGQTSYLYAVEDGVIRAIDYYDVAAWVWIAGIAALCISSVVSYWKLKRTVRCAILTENGCWECGEIETAFVLGFLPPKIYLPMGLSEEDRKFIYAHENTHIARHDHWYKLLGYIVLAVHWFNPLVWAAYSLLCRDIELACDERVVKDMDVQQRKAYSNALLSCAGKHRTIAACPVAFGETSVKQRIISVLHYKKPGFWICLAAVVAVVFVVVCLMTSPGAGEPDLSMLNYENAIPLVAEQKNVFVIYSYPGEEEDIGYLSISKADGQKLAVFLDNVNWIKWFDTASSSGFSEYIDLTIQEGYSIRVYDSGYAKVAFGEETRCYRISGRDYRQLRDMISPATPADFEETDVSIADTYLEKCKAALERFQQQESYHVLTRLANSNGNYGEIQSWQVGEDWLNTTRTNGTTDQPSYLKKDGNCYTRSPSAMNGGELTDWYGGFTFEDEKDQMPWLRIFDWNSADIHVVRQGIQGEIETIPYAEGPFETITCIVTGPFEAYRKQVCAGILTFTFDVDDQLSAVELVAVHDESVLEGEETITEELILGYGEDITQISTQILSYDREEIMAVLDGAYNEVPGSERERAMAARYIALCKAAWDALQSKECYHVRSEYEFYQGTHLDARNTVEYWFDGENRLRVADIGSNSMTRTYLLYGGEVYLGVEDASLPELEPSWQKVSAESADAVSPWFASYQWKDWAVQFEAAVGNTVWLRVEAETVIDGMTAAAHTLLFTFDAEGELLYASVSTENSDGTTMVQTTKLLEAHREEIAEIIESAYAEVIGQ